MSERPPSLGLDVSTSGTTVTLTLPPDVVESIVETVVERVRVELAADPASTWPEFMDVKTAARYLGCEVGAVRKLYERRKVAYYQEARGCKVYLRRRDLDDYMDAGRQGPRGELTGRLVTS